MYMPMTWLTWRWVRTQAELRVGMRAKPACVRVARVSGAFNLSVGSVCPSTGSEIVSTGGQVQHICLNYRASLRAVAEALLDRCRAPCLVQVCGE